MRVDVKLTAVTVGVLAAIACGLYFQFHGAEDITAAGGSEILRARHMNDAAAREQARRSRAAARRAAASSARRVNEMRERPRLLELDDEEERELTDLAKKVLASLQAALDADDLDQLKDILGMVRGVSKGALSKRTDGMPVAMRKRLVEALGWFGNAALPELLEFLADPDPEVMQMSADQFQLALEDIELGDRERAEIIVMASRVLNDSDILEQMFMELNNTRHSVGIAALLDILAEGTDAAKALVPDQAEFYTGEELETAEDMVEWLEKNPDDADDDDLYGPMK